MNRFKLFAIACVILLFSAGIASADNITISDEVNTTSSTWYADHEDQEVEPNCLTSQAWDLEAFQLNDSILSIVGGFDFKNGYDGVYAGDLFLDVDGDAQYGPTNDGSGSGNKVVQNTFGYDYVLDFDFQSLTYTVYKLNESSTTTVYYSQNAESNPLSYNSGGEFVKSGSLSYTTGLTDAQTGFTGGTHNVIGNLDLSFLPEETGSETVNFIAHMTISCGNDNLMGAGTVTGQPIGGGGSNGTPEPATMLLLASGIAGLAGLRKKFIVKN